MKLATDCSPADGHTSPATRKLSPGAAVRRRVVELIELVLRCVACPHSFLRLS